VAGDLGTHVYTRRDLRRLAKVNEQQLRSWEKRGLIASSETYGYLDLIAIRTLAELRRNKVPAAKIRSAVVALREKLAGIKDPLVELRLFSDGRNIRVQVEGQTMEPTSGQLLLGFDEDELRRMVAFPVDRSKARAAPSRQRQREAAEQLFQEALELEQTGAPLDAIRLYQKVLEADPFFAGALVNLGTLYFSAGELERARQYYQEAIAADPGYALAHFNLGNLYDELGDRPAALSEYQTALDLHPRYADAHYNIALLYEATGQVLLSVRHWKAYLKLDPKSPWANEARRQLNRLYRQTVVDSG
jgi:tetratricopeptide (TPR) repeat protein